MYMVPPLGTEDTQFWNAELLHETESSMSSVISSREVHPLKKYSSDHEYEPVVVVLRYGPLFSPVQPSNILAAALVFHDENPMFRLCASFKAVQFLNIYTQAYVDAYDRLAHPSFE